MTHFSEVMAIIWNFGDGFDYIDDSYDTYKKVSAFLQRLF